MEEMTGRPIDVEVLFDEGRAVAVHGLRKLDGFFFGLPHCPQPVYLLFKGSINKNVKGVGTVAEVICRAASHNYGVALLRRCSDHALRDLPDAFGVHDLHPWGVQTPFEAASHKRLEQTVVERISSLLMLL